MDEAISAPWPHAMYSERSILHFNVADFAVAVERVADSSLRRRPLIIAPLQAARAVVYDMSEEAFCSGVRKGMPLFQATRRCRRAQVLPPRIGLYQRAMGDFLGRVRRFSPLVEHGLADGHLFVDVTGTHRLFGPAPDIGWRVRREVRGDLGIDPIWTLSSNKLVAKVASRLVKPVGEYIVAPGEEQEFLAPLPVFLLPGITRGERRRFREFNILRIGQLAGLNRNELLVPFGRRSGYLYDASRGVDPSRVTNGVRRDACIVQEHHFGDDTNDSRRLKEAVARLAAQVALQLRRGGQEARRLVLRLTYSDGATVQRQLSRRIGSSSDFVLRDMALLVLQRAWRRRTRIRSCHLFCDRLHRRSTQQSLLQMLPQQSKDNEAGLLEAMDTIRDRFGQEVIGTGVDGTGGDRGRAQMSAG